MSAIRLKYRQRGVSLITAVFIITAMAVIAAAMVRLSANTAVTSGYEILSAQAFYAAESGIDWTAFQITTGNPSYSDCSEDSGNHPLSGDAWFRVTVSCDLDLGSGKQVFRLVSTGKAGGTAGSPVVQRTVMVLFKP